MRTTLDCAVLMPPAHARWMEDWMSARREGQDRVRFWPMPIAGDHDHPAPDPAGVLPLAQALCRLGPALRRYDACLLPVAPQTLAWTRIALADAGNGWPVPLLALARDLKAAAIHDLLELGLDDFVRETACIDEIAVRVERGRRSRAAEAAAPEPVRRPPEVAEAGAAYPAMPYASRASHPKPGLASALPGDSEGAGHLPFRTAKSRVVVAFERQYIHDALARSSGNIAVASRAARKHRRAFWALMRKHQIDAAPYRQAAEDGPVIPP